MVTSVIQLRPLGPLRVAGEQAAVFPCKRLRGCAGRESFRGFLLTFRKKPLESLTSDRDLQFYRSVRLPGFESVDLITPDRNLILGTH
jgi:hypothetical protein